MEEAKRVGPYEVPALGIGTLRNRGAEGAAFVEAALAAGFRHVDTAQMYDNEEAVGAALARTSVRRDDVWLTTKLLHPKTPPPPDIREAAVESLRRLGVDYVDSLLVHWPHPDLPLEHALDALVRLREEGKTRTIGVCNVPSRLLERALDAAGDLGFVQVEYHPYLAQDAVLALVRTHDMLLTAHCPLARGRVLDDPVLIDIAAAHGRTAAQIALGWAVQQHKVTAVVGGSLAHRHRLEENLAALEVRLSEEEMQQVSALARGVRVVDPPFSPQWDS